MKPLVYSLVSILGITFIGFLLIFFSDNEGTAIPKRNLDALMIGQDSSKVFKLIGKPGSSRYRDSNYYDCFYKLEEDYFYTRTLLIRFRKGKVDTIIIFSD